MWQTPSRKTRGPKAAGKGGGGKVVRLQRPMHIRRTAAQIRILAKPTAAAPVTEARLILNDISPNGLSLFCASPLAVGTEVAITLEEPVRVYVRGRIVSCLEYDPGHHIVSAQSFSYRVGILLHFETPTEKAGFKEFVEMIASNYLYTSKAA
jgi:hypothetical protein